MDEHGDKEANYSYILMNSYADTLLSVSLSKTAGNSTSRGIQPKKSEEGLLKGLKVIEREILSSCVYNSDQDETGQKLPAPDLSHPATSGNSTSRGIQPKKSEEGLLIGLKVIERESLSSCVYKNDQEETGQKLPAPDLSHPGTYTSQQTEISEAYLSDVGEQSVTIRIPFGRSTTTLPYSGPRDDVGPSDCAQYPATATSVRSNNVKNGNENKGIIPDKRQPPDSRDGGMTSTTEKCSGNLPDLASLLAHTVEGKDDICRKRKISHDRGTKPKQIRLNMALPDLNPMGEAERKRAGQMNQATDLTENGEQRPPDPRDDGMTSTAEKYSGNLPALMGLDALTEDGEANVSKDKEIKFTLKGQIHQRNSK